MQEAIKDGEPTRLSVFFMSFEPASVMHIYSTSVMQFCKTIDKRVLKTLIEYVKNLIHVS